MYTVTPNAIRGAAAGALALGALLAPTAASAIVTIEGIDLPVGAVFKSSTIFENTVTFEGDVLSGVGRVNSIEDINGNVTWSPSAGRELTFTFDNFVVRRITNSGDVAEVFFSGGTAGFFSDSTPDLDLSGSQINAFATAGDGAAFLNLVGATTGQNTVAGDFGGAGIPITLKANLEISSGDLTAISAGNGLGFLDVDTSGSGAANAFFNTNSFPSGQDIELKSDFSTTNAANAFPLRGSADFSARTAIPEPSTLGLFGIGLIGLGFAARRRRQR